MIDKSGLLANRPAPQIVGFCYYATDEWGGTLYRSNGYVWERLWSECPPPPSVSLRIVPETLAIEARVGEAGEWQEAGNLLLLLEGLGRAELSNLNAEVTRLWVDTIPKQPQQQQYGEMMAAMGKQAAEDCVRTALDVMGRLDVQVDMDALVSSTCQVKPPQPGLLIPHVAIDDLDFEPSVDTLAFDVHRQCHMIYRGEGYWEPWQTKQQQQSCGGPVDEGRVHDYPASACSNTNCQDRKCRIMRETVGGPIEASVPYLVGNYNSNNDRELMVPKEQQRQPELQLQFTAKGDVRQFHETFRKIVDAEARREAYISAEITGQMIGRHPAYQAEQQQQPSALACPLCQDRAEGCSVCRKFQRILPEEKRYVTTPESGSGRSLFSWELAKVREHIPEGAMTLYDADTGHYLYWQDGQWVVFIEGEGHERHPVECECYACDPPAQEEQIRGLPGGGGKDASMVNHIAGCECRFCLPGYVWAQGRPLTGQVIKGSTDEGEDLVLESRVMPEHRFADEIPGFLQGTLCSRPVAGIAGRLFFATDEGNIPPHADSGALYADTGKEWVLMAAGVFRLYIKPDGSICAKGDDGVERVLVGPQGGPVYFPPGTYTMGAAAPPGPATPAEPSVLVRGERPRDQACHKCALQPPFGWRDEAGETFFCKGCAPKNRLPKE